MKSFLEKTFILTFNKEESIFKEDEKLEAPSAGGGRGFGFMSSFSSGAQYKNIKSKTFIQDQEFFGKQFLIKEDMQPYNWKMGSESKQIGTYTAFKATAMVPAEDLNWMQVEFRGRDNRGNNDEATTENTEELITEPEVVEVIAWYTPMVPVSQGPGEYWGLPGLIVELSAGNTVMICSKIIMNPDNKEDIKMPEKGKEVTKKEYKQIITEKMEEFRSSRGRDGGGRGRD
jgi:GLPGLI family protein